MPKVINHCRKHATVEELPLRQIFDDVCRTVDAGGNDFAVAIIESSMYKRRRTVMPSLPTSPRDADAAITESICVAGRCAVLPRFSEHWRRWHSSDLRQRRQLYSYYVRVVWCTSTPVIVWCLRYFISYLRFLSSTPITRFRCCTLSWPGKQLHCIKASSKSCMH